MVTASNAADLGAGIAVLILLPPDRMIALSDTFLIRSAQEKSNLLGAREWTSAIASTTYIQTERRELYRPVSKMSLTRDRMFTSRPFLFVVEGAIYYLHDDAVSKVSPVFERMMHGNFQEKIKGYAVLQGVDKATFERFAQWAYRGYYDVPEPITQSVSTRAQTSGGQEAIEGTAINPVICDDNAKLPIVARRPCRVQKRPTGRPALCAKKRRDNLREAFNKRDSIVRQTGVAFYQPGPNLNRGTDYTEVFLCHAKLYVFAEERDVVALKLLALEALHAELRVFMLQDERIGDIATLIGYVYDNTRMDGDDLRNLMVQYMAVEAETLSKSSEFRELIMDIGGSLLDDFFAAVARKMAEAT